MPLGTVLRHGKQGSVSFRFCKSPVHTVRLMVSQHGCQRNMFGSPTFIQPLLPLKPCLTVIRQISHRYSQIRLRHVPKCSIYSLSPLAVVYGLRVSHNGYLIFERRFLRHCKGPFYPISIGSYSIYIFRARLQSGQSDCIRLPRSFRTFGIKWRALSPYDKSRFFICITFLFI